MKLVGPASTTVTQSFACVYMASAQTLTRVWALLQACKVGSYIFSYIAGSKRNVRTPS